ncbi:MAG: NGG1p interacting factor NIF3 [Candidatus Aminicenantes bacterium]|nr:NGG1p interacting factor NIF3 [Candidatus Aminicenantes bacterium]
MKLDKFYKKAVSVGIENDLRDKKEIDKLMEMEKKKFEKLCDEDKEFYDKDRLFNPFSDTRILYGDQDTEIKKVIVGIDMEIGEILLTHKLNEERNENIDCIISHHPEGFALAQLYDVMRLQADLLSLYGITISVAEQLMEKRISEVERGILPVNHNRAVDAARILNIPMICIHTPADNCVTNYLKKLFEKEKPYDLKELLKILIKMPEYKKSSLLQAPPKIINGSENNKCGKIYVDMTGGTGGSEDIFDKIANSGISTIVGMHIGEKHLKKAKQANLNIVIAGHISSDTLGLNLLFDEIEKTERLEFIGISGFERFRRI